MRSMIDGLKRYTDRFRCESEGEGRGAVWIVWGIWFVIACAIFATKAKGGDLAPLVIAGRLVVHGLAGDLYASVQGALLVHNANWTSEALQIGYSGRIFPFIYPPLVAYAYAPLAAFDFRPLLVIAIPLHVGAIAAIVHLALRQWCRRWLRPLPLLMMLFGLLFAFPFVAAADALNIQVFVDLLVVAAMAAGQNGRPRLAGSALALAAFVKLLPCVIVLYWIATRRYKCVAWFAATGAALVLGSVAVAGYAANLAYLDSLHRLLGELVPIVTNKGLPNLLYGLVAPLDRIETFVALPLPRWISIVNLIALVAGLAWVLHDARKFRPYSPEEPPPHRQDIPVKACDGAGMAAAFMIATMTSSMAWSHHYIFLPVMMAIWGGLESRGVASWAVPLATWIFSSVAYKVGAEWLAYHGGPDCFVGGELVAGALITGAMLLRRRRYLAHRPPAALRFGTGVSEWG
jgi:hypothetical protein